MAASYIGIDLQFPPEDDESRTSPYKSSAVQVMHYQYHIVSKDSSIAYVLPKRDRKYYDKIVDSMRMMWQDSEEIEL